MCGLACEAFFPRIIGVEDLAALFAKTNSTPSRVTHIGFVVKRHFDAYLHTDQSGALLETLNELVKRPPHVMVGKKETRISSAYVWILDMIPTVLLRVLANEIVTDRDCRIAVDAIALLAESRHFSYLDSERLTEIDPATRKHPAVRRALFWQSVSRWRGEGGTGQPGLWHCFNYGSVAQLNSSDIEWLVQDVSTPPDAGDQLLSLQVALQLGAARTRRDRHLLARAVGSSTTLNQNLARALSANRWRWARRLWAEWTDPYLWRDRWSTLISQLTQWWDSYKSRRVLRRSVPVLQSGKAIGLLYQLLRESAKESSKFAGTNWASLADKSGAVVANAVKAGCKRCFRDIDPPLLPHEMPEPTRIEPATIVGLAGLQALLDDNELSFRSMTEDEVSRATRYAVHEINGPPAWFAELAQLRPGPVGTILKECIEGEWRYHANHPRPYNVLGGLAWRGGSLATMVRDTVIDLFRKGNPGNLEILEFALQLLLRTCVVPDHEIGTLAAERCSTEPSINTDEFVLWSSVCLQCHADRALEILEERLKGDDAGEVMSRICNALGGEIRNRLPVLSNPDYLRPSAIRNFIRITFRLVRPKDDIDRSNTGPFTPTMRDGASRFRDSLLTRLSQSESPDASTALSELSDVADLKDVRDWILHLVDERSMKDADLDTWSPSDVRAFEASCKTDSSVAGARPLVIVTVNKHETRAILDAFEAAVGCGATPFMLGARMYHDLGVLNGTRVIHAISEMGSAGLGAMQQTVDKASRSLSPRAVVAAGIAFGVDDGKQALGDVLVSTHVWLYDLQRVGKDEIVLRGPRPDASPWLLNYLKGYYLTNWKRANVTFGAVLTGEKLIDNVDYRNQLLKLAGGVIGGEMEGAGLYVSSADHKVDWIVVKAICDFADGNKGKDKESRQILAATNAAHLLVDALQYVPLFEK
jgi:nucleoside phosphorylase